MTITQTAFIILNNEVVNLSYRQLQDELRGRHNLTVRLNSKRGILQNEVARIWSSERKNYLLRLCNYNADLFGDILEVKFDHDVDAAIAHMENLGKEQYEFTYSVNGYTQTVRNDVSVIFDALRGLVRRSVRKSLEITFYFGDRRSFDTEEREVWYPEEEKFNPWRAKYYVKADWKSLIPSYEVITTETTESVYLFGGNDPEPVFSQDLIDAAIRLGYDTDVETLTMLQEEEDNFDTEARDFITEAQKLACLDWQIDFSFDPDTQHFLDNKDTLGYWRWVYPRVSVDCKRKIRKLMNNYETI